LRKLVSSNIKAALPASAGINPEQTLVSLRPRDTATASHAEASVDYTVNMRHLLNRLRAAAGFSIFFWRLDEAIRF
jgi:hypothetical protein